jgi:hypothetical protein
MFAAQNGAARVYAVEASGMSSVAETLIKENQLDVRMTCTLIEIFT